MAKEKPKDVHVDLLEIDMQEGVNWLHPAQLHESDPRHKTIQQKHREKHLAEQRSKTSK